MRRPALTKAQRQHAREQRALLRLRRAAVRRSLVGDGEIEMADGDAVTRADLDAACDAYTNVLTTRERRKLAK
ncbi:MAG TPA: hypothetical protein VMZ53_03775 [Kofleriaceae bacterium]|nr:hypothetical protein [Kofleriaceae bacterium]